MIYSPPGRLESQTANAMPDETPPTADEDTERAAAARRRLVRFGLHLAAYFIVMLVLAPLNFWKSPENPWVLLPMVGWGGVLALHVAYVMGLFGLLGDD